MRINGGHLRGRKIVFPDVDGLRPTLGRARETLFNWLRPMLTETQCLDLFAGTGARGIEASSNGAGRVTFVEWHPVVADSLKHTLQQLGLQDNTTLEIDHALAFLQRTNEPFDVIFLDPPFAAQAMATQAFTRSG